MLPVASDSHYLSSAVVADYFEVACFVVVRHHYCRHYFHYCCPGVAACPDCYFDFVAAAVADYSPFVVVVAGCFGVVAAVAHHCCYHAVVAAAHFFPPYFHSCFRHGYLVVLRLACCPYYGYGRHDVFLSPKVSG